MAVFCSKSKKEAKQKKLNTVIHTFCIMLVMIMGLFAFAGCLTDSSDSATESANINIEEYIPAFEEIVNCVAWDESVDFAKISTKEVIKTYITGDGNGSALAQLFAKETKESVKHDDAYEDPKNKLAVWQYFDSDSIDWILTNVFGKKPDKTLEDEYFYYYENRVYCIEDIATAKKDDYLVANYKSIGDGKYEITVAIDPGLDGIVGNVSEYLMFVASPHNDPEYGEYWRIYSCEKLAQKIESNTTAQDSNAGYGTAEQLRKAILGSWESDADKTYNETGNSMMSLFGSSIKYGSEMKFNSDGSFEYYIAAGNGGEGTFSVLNSSTISYEIVTYESGYDEDGLITIEKDGDRLFLVMDYFGDKVYWSKNS